MSSAELYQLLGVSSIVLMWAAILFMLYRWKPTMHRSISQHAAASREAFVFYSSLVSFSLVLFTIFVYGWLIPTYRLPEVFSVLAAATILAEFVTVLTPDNGGKYSKLHRPCAFGVTFALPVLLLLIVLSPDATTLVQVVGAVAIAVMLLMLMCIVLVVFVLKPNPRRPYLVPQACYYALFHLPILVAIFAK